MIVYCNKSFISMFQDISLTTVVITVEETIEFVWSKHE